jgi:hypothetical protein
VAGHEEMTCQGLDWFPAPVGVAAFNPNDTPVPAIRYPPFTNQNVTVTDAE